MGAEQLKFIMQNPEQRVINLAIKGAAIYRVPTIEDDRGCLCVREAGRGLPFCPKRSFVVFNVPAHQVRGAHAHLSCHQLLICLQGSLVCTVDDGEQQDELVLNSPEVGLYIPPMVWAAQRDYSTDAVLQVLASECYDPNDLIYDYDRFLALRFAADPREQASKE